MYFQNYRLRKLWLGKCLKSPVSEDPSKNSMVIESEIYRNLYHSTFSLFIDQCEGNWGGKGFSSKCAKSSNCFLTHWLPVTSFLFLIGRNECIQFRWNYLKNKKLLQSIFLHFWNVDKSLNPLKKVNPDSWCIFEITDSENRC